MANIQLRNFRKADIKTLYNIIINPKFIHIILPKSFKSYETYFLKKLSKRKEKLEYNYAVIFENNCIGTGAIKVDNKKLDVGELTYIIDEKFWGKGVGTEVAKLLERTAFEKLNLAKTQIWMSTKNIASEKIAINLGYNKEKFLKKRVKERDGKLTDVFVYSKLNRAK